MPNVTTPPKDAIFSEDEPLYADRNVVGKPTLSVATLFFET
jgi:hypothetical protein